MRRFSILAATIALLAISVAPAAADPGEAEVIEARLVDTQIVDGGKMWFSEDILHARNVGVTDNMVEIGSGDAVGTLVRSVNFNWDQAALADGDVVSQAWCSFTMYFEDPAYGTVPGRCNGSLISGHIVGNGTDAQLRGWYELDPGGIPSVGPYSLILELESK